MGREDALAQIETKAYWSPEDGTLVVEIDTPGVKEDAEGPRLRLYLNDGVVYENPPYPGAELAVETRVTVLHRAAELCGKLQSYIAQMAPHQRSRRAAKLLLECHEFLSEVVDVSVPTSTTNRGFDGRETD